MSEAPFEAGADGMMPAPRRRHRNYLDMIVSFSAIFISAVSLFVAIEHGRTERDLVAANSWPFLRAILSNGYDDKGTIAIGLADAGVGPAKVKTFELFYRHRPVSSGYDLLRRCCGLGKDPAAVRAAFPHGLSYSLVDESVIRPGEDNPVLKIRRAPEAKPVIDRLAGDLKDVSFRVCYCSVLDQCWRGDLLTTTTQPVSQCPAPEHRFEPDGP